MQNDSPQVAALPLIQNQYVLPSNVQPQTSAPRRRQCRCKCRKWCKNHRKVLKVLAGLGVFLVTPIITILRLVSSIIGLRSLRKRDPVLLVAFCGMAIYDILLTLCAPILAPNLFSAWKFMGDHGGHGGHHRGRGPVGGCMMVLMVLHGLFTLLVQIVVLVKGVKFYKAEKVRHSSTVETEDEFADLPDLEPSTQRTQIPVENVSPEPIVYDSSLIASLPPLEDASPPSLVREQLQVPVVVPLQVQEKNSWQPQLALLREMGFGDERKNLEMLEKEQGNVQRVIRAYIS